MPIQKTPATGAFRQSDLRANSILMQRTKQWLDIDL